MQAGPLQPSGRVIAGGRLLLACLFLVATLAATGEHARAQIPTYALLAAYAAWSLGLTLAVWRDWWLDARLAAPAHVIDVAVFMLMLYSTEGYTSPYFIFFIFILLAAAIRWGWKETAITAAAVTAAYLAAGLVMGPPPAAEAEGFIVRTGHLLIISSIMVWFGANHWIALPRAAVRGDSPARLEGDPFVAALQAEMDGLGARRGMLLWRESADEEITLVTIVDGKPHRSAAAPHTAIPELAGSLLFDLRKDRVLMRADASRWRFLRASDALPPGFAAHAEGAEGLAVPLATGAADGLAVFQRVRALSTDHLDFAPRVALAIAERLQEAALFAAVEERSMAKARIAVARDLHDSIVQFLAGLGFQLEALNRSPAANGAIADSLAELKEAVVDEQRHLRAFIRGLRTGGSVSIADLSRDCASLCQLLARQWGVDCAFSADAGSGAIPVRMQLDIQQLVREAVANAVRHGGAKRVAVSLRGERRQLCLTIADDGRGFASATAAGSEVPPPASLSARVLEARGKLQVRSKAGKTSVSIRLPLEAAA